MSHLFLQILSPRGNKFQSYKGIEIIFAYRSFVWSAETKYQNTAKVHCVIIGFKDKLSKENPKKYIFTDNGKDEVKNINPYLIEAPNCIITSRSKPINNVAEMRYGSMPIDDGHLILEKEDVENLLSENKNNKDFIKKYVGGQEIIKNKKRWCLWLDKMSPSEYNKSKIIMERIAKTKEFRENSKRQQTKNLAEFPYLFGEIRQPSTTMVVIPKVSSESRRYIPVSLINPDIIINGSALLIPNANLFTFGILISNVHMAWMRTVAGRMKSDYQYSANVVYNNFPWPEITEIQKEKIAKSAQAILDARAQYPESSLADLYDELTMPKELRKAHQANDKAVMEAYNMTKIVNGKKTWLTESETVARLLEMYEDITKTK